MYEKKWFLRLDTKKQYDNEVITMVKQDTYSNVLYIVLYNDSIKMEVSKTTIATVIIDKPDNTQVIGSAEVLDNGTLKYVVDYQALAALGMAKFTVKLILEDNILTTTSFVVNVISDPFENTNGSIESTSEYPILTSLISETTNIIASEEIRVDNENQRLENENIRKSNEITRQSNETTRQNNETNRTTKETERQTNETTRQSNETARQSAETLRNTRETTREENEGTRKTNETNRLSAETTRNTNETTRQNNETTRQSNETTRENNEQLRVQLYNDLMAQLDRIEQIQQQVPEQVVTDLNIVSDLANQLQIDLATHKAEIGNIEELNTNEKSSIVGSINEISTSLAQNARKTPWGSIDAVGNYDPNTGAGTDDTQAFADAIQSNSILILKDGKYKITSSIYLKNNLTIIGVGNPIIYGVGVTELFKTNPSTTYNNIRLVNIGIDGGKVPNDDNIRVCAQFYNVQNLSIEKCRFYNASAAIGLDGCVDVWIGRNIIEGMFQQTSSAIDKAGSYGYGVVANECRNIWIENNVLGNIGVNKQIDRHAIYVSNHAIPGESTNSRKVFVRGNSIVQKSYLTDSDIVTGFEYVLKSIGGSYIEFEDNVSFGGYGGILLGVNYVNGGQILAKNNKFYDLLKVGVLITCDPVPSDYYFENIRIEDNYFEIKGTYGRGIVGMNFKELISKRNTFVSTVADVTLKNPCYYIRRTSENNNVQATKFISEDNYVNGFKQLGYINRVDHFVCDDVVENFPTADGVWSPFTYADSVIFRKTKIRFVKDSYKFKKDTTTGLVGLTYFDSDLNSEITCISVSPPNWVNPTGEQVVCTLATRPNVASINRGYKVWEQDSSRLLYFSGISWETINKIIPRSGTKAVILAIDGGSSYSDISIYNTEDKKPYWWDAYTRQWKDASGTVLV